MPTGLETLKEEFAKTWSCPKHLGIGPLDTNPLQGASHGCEACIIQVAAIVTSVMGVHIPPKRDPGPKIPVVSEQPRSGAIYEKCRAMGHEIGEKLPPGVGFCLMVFEFQGHQLEYICNAQRPDMITLLGEFQTMLSKEGA